MTKTSLMANSLIEGATLVFSALLITTAFVLLTGAVNDYPEAAQRHAVFPGILTCHLSAGSGICTLKPTGLPGHPYSAQSVCSSLYHSLGSGKAASSSMTWRVSETDTHQRDLGGTSPNSIEKATFVTGLRGNILVGGKSSSFTLNPLPDLTLPVSKAPCARDASSSTV